MARIQERKRRLPKRKISLINRINEIRQDYKVEVLHVNATKICYILFYILIINLHMYLCDVCDTTTI